MKPPGPVSHWYQYDSARNVLSLRLHVQPGARRTEFAGLYGDSLKVRVAAPAVENKANTLLVDFLGKTFKLPARRVMIARGRQDRTKIVEIHEPGAGLLEHIRLLVD